MQSVFLSNIKGINSLSHRKTNLKCWWWGEKNQSVGTKDPAHLPTKAVAKYTQSLYDTIILIKV